MLGASTFAAGESVGVRQVCGRPPEGLASNSGQDDGWALVPGGQALRGLGAVRQGPAVNQENGGRGEATGQEGQNVQKGGDRTLWAGETNPRS